MKSVVLFVAVIISMNLFGQEKIELPKLQEPFVWDVELIPFEDGSYAVTAYSWETYITTMYSAKHEKLNSVVSKKEAWRFYNGTGTTGAGSVFNESFVDTKTKNSYTLQANFKKLSFSITNSEFETQVIQSQVDIDGFNSHGKKVSFADQSGNAYFLFWQDVIRAGDQRKVLVVFYNNSTKKLAVKMNELSPIDAAYFSFLGFLDEQPVFGSMKSGTVRTNLLLNLYTLKDDELSKTSELDLKLGEEIRPDYISGIDYDKLDSEFMSFAIGLSKMDGLLTKTGNGFKFIQLENLTDYKEVDWWLDDYEVKGDVPMASVVLNDHLERVILSGAMFKLVIDVDFKNQKVTNQKIFDVDGGIYNCGFWTYLLSKDFDSSNSITAVENIINPNQSENAMIAETPQMIVFNDKSFIIATVHGKQSRQLEILRGNKY